MAIVLSLSSCEILSNIPVIGDMLNPGCKHTESEWKVDKEATCMEAGSEHLECSQCETTLETREISKLKTHKNTEWKVDKAATCSETGTKHLECSVCKEVFDTAIIGKTAHTERVIPSVAATCTTSGLTQGKECSVCKAVIAEQTVIPALPHVEKIVNGKNPTCTEAGLTDGKVCSKCNTVLLKQETIAAIGHTEETVAGKKATCTEAGLTDGKKCSVCKVTLLEQKPIAITAHTESEWIIDKNAEVGVDGSKHKECLVCKKLLKTETIPAIVETHVHEGIEWVTVTPATCTSTGVKHFICECGQKMGEDVIAIIPHTEETVAGKKATCTEEGLTEGKKCSVCGEILVAQTATEKAPHTEQIIPGIAATCTETGLTTGKKCSVCNKILVAQSGIAKADHTEQIVAGIAATCTEAGRTDGKVCAVCTLTLEVQLPIPPTGHSFTDGTCTGCGTVEPYGIWIVDGQGNPISGIIVKVMKNGEQIKMFPYNGTFLSMALDNGSYEIVLDLSQLSDAYTYDESLCVLTPESRTITVRLFKTVSDEPDESIYVGYPLNNDYNAYYVGVGSTSVPLTPGGYSFFVFRPTASAIYAITYECSSTLSVGYYSSTFFSYEVDISQSSEVSTYENGIAIRVYSSNVGGDYVIGIKSNVATSCVLNIKNAGDPGTRLEDEPWTPYLEDSARVEEQLAMNPEGTYTVVDVTDANLKAVYNEEDGYYHLGTVDGPIIFIDLTAKSLFTDFSIQTICCNQRIGAYIYDATGKVVEKRSYNELFTQYGMSDNADEVVTDPIRVALTAKLAEAITTFGDKNGWWTPDADSNIFGSTPYNQEFAWLLFCGYYA